MACSSTSSESAKIVNKNGYYVDKAWSQAGNCTCILMKLRNGPKDSTLVFDIGISTAEVLNAAHIFLSHGHLDHCGAIFKHARMRSRDMKPAKYYMHPSLIPALVRAKCAFEELGDDEIPMEIVPIQPGDEMPIGGRSFVCPFETSHRVKSQGYLIRSKVSQGLFSKYKDLPCSEIKKLKESGIEVVDYVEIVEVAYSGDTRFSALLQVPALWKAKVLIIEVTYLSGNSENAEKWGHVHLDSVVKHLNLFEDVDKLIICHISSRYSSSEILSTLRSTLPMWLALKTSVMLKEFGMAEYLTPVIN